MLRAIEEYDEIKVDAFLERYDFGPSRRYWLVHRGKRYVSKAIVAAAYRHEHGTTLSKDDFSGGIGHAVDALERLGFTIVDTARTWREEELVLALQVYLDHGQQRLDRRHPAIVALGRSLDALASLRQAVDAATPHRPAEVAILVDKFRGLDLEARKEDRRPPSPLHRKVWKAHAGKPYSLRARAQRVLAELASERADDARPERSSTTRRRSPRGRGATGDLDVPFRSLEIKATAGRRVSWIDPERYDRANRAHETTRRALRDFLVQQGFGVGQGRKASGLEHDLSAHRGDLYLVVEAKSLPPEVSSHHAQLRLGLGQVLWYRHCIRRRAQTEPIAVLLVESEPVDANEWIGTCRDVDVVLTWPERFGDLVGQCERLARGGAR